MAQKYFKNSPNHKKDLISSKLFRTSTQYLIEPPPIDSHESTALSPMVMSNHTPYFAIGSEDGYSYENSFPLGKQKMPQIKYNKKVEKEDQKYEVKNERKERKSRSPDKLKKIENILKSVAIEHKQLKLKLQMARNQMKEKQVLALSPKSNNISHSLATTPKNRLWTPPVSPKFKITGNMTERYNKSLLIKTTTIQEEKLAKEREEMRECTFSPRFVSKAITEQILAKKELQRLRREQQKYAFEPEQDDSVFIKIKRKEKFSYFKKPTRFQYDQFKGLIKNQLERVNLQRPQSKRSLPKEPEQTSPPRRKSP